ncbi:MAG: hypothetical protein ACREOI_02675 [bacterium]
MIQPLRRRHRWMMAAITVILPVVFVAGLAVRKPIPATENIPAASTSPSSMAFTHLLFEKTDLWPELKITTRVYADQQPAERLAVELHPQDYLKIPDLLVYWHPQPSIQTDKLPDGAYLLGALAGTQKLRCILPEPAMTQDGSLILYSLAHQKIIAATMLPTSKFIERIAK